MPKTLHIGPYALRNAVLLAPMAGVADAPFRAAAWRLGAGLTVAEMAASRELLKGRQLPRLAGEDIGQRPNMVQLAGHDAQMMASAAALALEHGAQVIDINMGCPARLVTGKLSGAALMREPRVALDITRAVWRVAQDAGAPVTVKMRLGWDETTLNAPQLAVMLADAGVAMITVHGRTRAQFYNGRANWRAVGEVRRALTRAGHESLPLIVNGDITDAASARAALAQSGADGVMIGRAAMGRPWLPGEIAARLAPGSGIAPLPPARQVREILALHRHMTAFHGPARGVRRARKHLKAALAHWQAQGWLPPRHARQMRELLLRAEDAAMIHDQLARLAQTAPHATRQTEHA